MKSQVKGSGPNFKTKAASLVTFLKDKCFTEVVHTMEKGVLNIPYPVRTRPGVDFIVNPRPLDWGLWTRA